MILVLGLIYLGLGLDRNTQAAHSETWQLVVDKLIGLDVAEASSSEIADIIMQRATSPETLTPEEWW